jgi:hypothetical protein
MKLPENKSWKELVCDLADDVALLVLIFAFPTPVRWMLAVILIMALFSASEKRDKLRDEEKPR